MFRKHPNTSKNRTLQAATAALLGLAIGMFDAAALAEDVDALVQFAPDTPALAEEVNQNFEALRVGVNSKQDRASAAGLDFATIESRRVLQSQFSTVATVTLTVPAAGFVKVDFDSQSFMNHVTGSISGLGCRLERNGTLLRVRSWEVHAAEPTGGRNRPMHMSYAQPESNPGTVTYTVRCNSDGAVNSNVSNWTLSAVYFEHRY